MLRFGALAETACSERCWWLSASARGQRAGIEKPWTALAPSVNGMCFMFGASEEQKHRAFGLTGEAEHEELAGVGETPVSVPAAEDWPQD